LTDRWIQVVSDSEKKIDLQRW